MKNLLVLERPEITKRLVEDVALHPRRSPYGGWEGPFHCLLEDGNLEWQFVAYALESSETEEDVFLASLLAAMTTTQRRKLAAYV